MYWMELIRILVWVPGIILGLACFVITLRNPERARMRLMLLYGACIFNLSAASLNLRAQPPTIHKQIGIFVIIINMLVVAGVIWLVGKMK